MKEEALLRAHPGRLWIALLPPLAFCAAVAVGAWHAVIPFPPLPFALAALALAFLVGVLFARELPGARARAASALQLQAVSTVIGKAGGSLELQEVLDAITGSTVEVSGVRGCSIRLLDADGKTMSMRSIAGLPRDRSGLPAAAAESIASRSLREGRAVQIEGAALEDFPELDSGMESLVCVPLRHEGRVIGALCAYGERGRKLPPETLSFLSRLGDLAVLSIANASLYDSLKKVDDSKTWFLRKAAHELVSPLGVIQAITQNLHLGYYGRLTQGQGDEIERIRARAAGLAEVVADLLTLARGMAGVAGAPGSQRDTELCTLLGRTAAFFETAAREKEVRLEVVAPPERTVVAGTADGVTSILSNLVSNAIKYSKPGGTVSVTVSPRDDRVELVVSDQGIGIPAAEQEKVGKEFFRASNARSHTTAGTGLGLAIVRAEVAALGGSLELASVEGKGTTIRVLFPAAH